MTTQILTAQTITDAELQASAGGMVNPAAATGMTWKQVHDHPDTFKTRWAEYQAQHPQQPGLLGSTAR